MNLSELGMYKENNRIEAKKAAECLPNSIWPTYSAFANTDGGVILLGTSEMPDKSLVATGVVNPDKMLADFWNTLNNPQKVSFGLLSEKNVRVEDVEGKRVIVIEVPRADRAIKPIFINNNPYTGTYRRSGEGDFLCTKAMVNAMMRDNGDKTQDMLVLDRMPLNAFDYDSLRRYRNRMKSTRPGHVWEDLEDIGFLQKLGAVGLGEDGRLHPTSAGLLMFGFEHEILHEYPQFFLDYQERFDPSMRWTDRIISSSGEWSGNVFDFLFKAYNKLIQNPKIKVPFKMKDGLVREDDTSVHKALREALANCVSNADYYGERGLVIRNSLDGIIMENPGAFRITLTEARSGGISSPRNAVILKMLNLLDIGERTGSGIPLIFHAWEEQGWQAPQYSESFFPERTVLSLVFGKTSDKKRAIKTSDKQKNAKGESRKQEIIAFLREHGISKTSDMSKALGISDGRVRAHLLEMASTGRVTAIGENRNRVYELKEPEK